MKKTVILLVIALAFIGCGSDSSAKESETSISSKIESVEESIADSKEEESVISEEEQPEESALEDLGLEESQTEEPQHMNASWDKESVGPMTFDAPVSWKSKSSDTSHMFFSPLGPGEEYLGYSLSVGFNENRNGNIESFVSRDLEQYENVVKEDLEVAGYTAVRLQYDNEYDEPTTNNTVYYIQIYPESGLGIISYSAPKTEADLYREDFERLVNSVVIDGSPVTETYTEHQYVLNKATGTFHKPSCYKVDDIEDAETVGTTAEELVAKGYKACGICNPN